MNPFEQPTVKTEWVGQRKVAPVKVDRPPKVYDNPWNLTEAEALAMTAMVETGGFEGACLLLGKKHSVVEQQIRNSKRKMGLGTTTIKAVLKWDRFQRGL